MYKIICAHCGAEVETKYKKQIFCDKLCLARHHRAMNKMGLREPKQESVCRYNDGVVCEDQKCGTCGWNPKVSKKRGVRNG